MTRPKERRPTLADVARSAGVGKATASRALAATRHPDVGEETRARIWAAAEELGYRPSSTARALRTGRFHSLSVVVPYSLVEWLEPTLKGAGEEAARAGYQLMVHPVDPYGEGVGPLLDRLGDIPTDALVMVDPAMTPEQEERLRAVERPVVFFDDQADHPWAANIRAANLDGGYQVTKHLVECGRRRIAVVAPPGGMRFVSDRIAGYRAALAEAGMSASDELVITVDDPCSRPEALSIEMAPLMDAAPFDAVFAISDYLAAVVLRALRKAKLRVPDDVSVAGFDDERAAILVDPPLTTVRQPTAEMGRLAVRLAVRAAEGEPVQPEVHELPVELVVRESSVPGAR